MKRIHKINHQTAILILVSVFFINIQSFNANLLGENYWESIPQESQLDISSLTGYNRISTPFSSNENGSELSVMSNTEFISLATAKGWLGNGTEFNPYIVDNIETVWDKWTFTTNLHIIIKDCAMHGGLDLIYTTNIQLINNTVFYEILVSGGGNNLFLNNTLNCAIQLSSTRFNDFIGNVISTGRYNAVSTRFSIQNSFINNTISSEGGIYLQNSEQNTFRLNNFNGITGLTIYGDEVEEYQQEEVTNNSLNGKPILFFQEINGLNITQDCSQIILVGCDYININNMDLSNVVGGISAMFCSYLRIERNIFNYSSEINDVKYAIKFYKVDKSIIANNVFNYCLMGVDFMHSPNNDISSNIFTNNAYGLRIHHTYTSNIENNLFSNNTEYGMYLWGSQDNTIKNNILENNGIFAGGFEVSDRSQASVENNSVNNKPLIYWDKVEGEVVPSNAGQVILVDCKEVEVANQDFNSVSIGLQIVFGSQNYIHNISSYNNYQGVSIWHSDKNFLKQSKIFNCSQTGIHLEGASNNEISNNIIANNNRGIEVKYGSHNTIISENLIANNSYEGVTLEYGEKHSVEFNDFRSNGGSALRIYTASWTNIYFNNFIENSYTGNQAIDNSGLNNSFFYNFWSDWTDPDINYDNIIDQPYLVDENQNTYDSQPLIQPYNQLHFLIFPVNRGFIYPNSDSTISGEITIEWTAAIDSQNNHSITYQLDYSATQGTNWNLIASGIDTTSYVWNTQLVGSDGQYLLKVLALCSDGLSATEISVNTFSIKVLEIGTNIPTLEAATHGWSYLLSFTGLVGFGLQKYVHKKKTRKKNKGF